MMAMETSSPLAALQPSRHHYWPGTSNAPEFDNGFLRPLRPARDFNFKDMSMKKSNSDYFSFKPARGSSPTQSLAVDLSQNFHIDQSPQLPTPRRSLFTTTLNKIRHDAVTPPIPSSSPVPQDERMDCSPLPHKLPPNRSVPEVALCSPTPEPTPALEAPRPVGQLHRSESDPDQLEHTRQHEDAKKFNPMVHPVRPGMRKGASSNNIPTRRPRTSESSKPFWFGPTSHIAKPSLESFAESPPSERKLAPSVSNPSLIAESMNMPTNGSPVACPLPRRPTMTRHRTGLSRRTLSMQYHDSTRAMREQKRCCTTGSIQPSILLRDDYTLRLPHFRTADDPEGLPRISKETMTELLDGKYDAALGGDAAVIDCRFEYEFAGGHIAGAVNFNDKEELSHKLFKEKSLGRKALIFHCEYSVHRAPMMAKYIREQDRLVNSDQYPLLTYQEVYILDGGFHGFYSSHGDRCLGKYVEMDDKNHENACERGMDQLKKRDKRSKLSRAKTYAFGEHDQNSYQDSPVPTIPTGFPNLSTSIDAMDIDFTSPVELKFAADSPLAATFHAHRLAGPRRLGTY